MSALVDEIRFFFGKYTRIKQQDASLTRAGVLAPIFQKDGEPHFLLTRRTQDVEHHKGQISFPGGAVDQADRDITATALREAEEEIGLTAKHVEVLGVFDDIIVPTGFVVTPVVGYIPSLPSLTLNKSEVDSVLEVPVAFFLDPKNRQVVKMLRGGVVRDVYLFPFERNDIWGATAFIIHSFLQKVGGNF